MSYFPPLPDRLPETDEEWDEAWASIRRVGEFERLTWWQGFCAGGLAIATVTILFIWTLRLAGVH
jgi:hypothetical protein